MDFRDVRLNDEKLVEWSGMEELMEVKNELGKTQRKDLSEDTDDYHLQHDVAWWMRKLSPWPGGSEQEEAP